MNITNTDHGFLINIEDSKTQNSLSLKLINELMDFFTDIKTSCDSNKKFIFIVAQSINGTSLSGGNLKELNKIKNNTQALREFFDKAYDLCKLMQECSLPVIFAVDGLVIGGGLEFYLHADLRIATKKTSFLFKQMSIGLFSGFGGTSRMIELFGLSKTQDIIWNGQKITALSAKKMGLIHSIVSSKAAFRPYLKKIEAKFSNLSQTSVIIQKKILTACIAKNNHEEKQLILNNLINSDFFSFLERFNEK